MGDPEEFRALVRTQASELEDNRKWSNCLNPWRLEKLQKRHEEQRANLHAEQIRKATELGKKQAEAQIRLQAAKQRLDKATDERLAQLRIQLIRAEEKEKKSWRQEVGAHTDAVTNFLDTNLQQIRIGFLLSLVGGAAFIIWRSRLLHSYRSIAEIPPELFGWHILPLQGRVVAIKDDCTLLVQHVPRLRRLLPLSTPTSVTGLLQLRLFGIQLNENNHEAGGSLGGLQQSANNTRRPKIMENNSDRVLFQYRAEQILQVIANENRLVNFTLLARTFSAEEDSDQTDETRMSASCIVGYRRWPSPFVKDIAAELIADGIAEICDDDIIDLPLIEGGGEAKRNENAQKLAAHVEVLGTAQEAAQRKEVGRWEGWAEKERQWRVSTGDQQPPLRRALDWVGGFAAWRKRQLEDREKANAKAKGSSME
jgi:endonuclease YncB( thermonuclease family)